MRILDVGCGAGHHLRTALEANRESTAVGLDVDPAVVEQARANLRAWGLEGRSRLLAGDIRTGVDGLDGPRTMALPAGSSHLYAGSTVDSALATFTRERDTTPPDTTIDSAPSGSSSDRNPMVSFSSSDPSFTRGFECSLDSRIGGQKDDLSARVALLGGIEHVQSAELGHLEIRDDDVVFRLLKHLDALCAILGSVDDMPLTFEEYGEEFPHTQLIIDH